MKGARKGRAAGRLGHKEGQGNGNPPRVLRPLMRTRFDGSRKVRAQGRSGQQEGQGSRKVEAQGRSGQPEDQGSRKVRVAEIHLKC